MLRINAFAASLSRLWLLSLLMLSANGWAMLASPSPSPNGNYTVSWGTWAATGCTYYELFPGWLYYDCYWLEEKGGAGNWGGVSTPNWATSWNASGKPTGTYQYRIMHSYGDYYSGGQEVADGPFLVHAGLPPLPLSEQQEYATRNGDIDADGDLDIYVKRISGTSWQLPLPEFLLRRNSNGTYTVQTNLTPGNRYQINQWGLASTVVKLVDFNADGYMDILLTALSPASVSPNDILVFASTGQGAPPLKTRLMDNWVRAFAIDLLSYVDDPAYFNGAYQYECAIYSYTPFYFPRYDIDGYYWGTSIPFPYVVCGWETNPAFNSTAVTIGASVRNVLNAGTVIAGSTDAGWLGWGMSNVLGVPYMGGTLQTGTTLLPVDLIVDIQDDLALVRFRRVLGGFMQLLQYELGTQTPYETHFYTFTSTICAVSDNPTVCSVENVFRRVRQYPVDGHSIDACGNVPRSRCSIPIQTQTQIWSSQDLVDT